MNRKPPKSTVIFIGEIPPPDWGRDFPIFQPPSLGKLREILARHSDLPFQKMGLDLRDLTGGFQAVLLKFLEEATGDIVLRLREPVERTILSRALRVYKDGIFNTRSYLDMVVDSETIIAKKIKDLR